MMDFIVFASSVAALWRLGRIHYWSAFPFWYSKLALATVVYIAPKPTDEAWVYGWWSTFTPALLALMMLAAVEAFRRLAGRILPKERMWLSATCMISSFVAFTVPFLAFPPENDGWFAIYLWLQRAIVCGIAAAMIPPMIHELVAPTPAPVIAKLHFVFLALVNISIALAQVSFVWIKSNPGWTIVEYAHLTIYVAMLISWTMLTPRAISCEA